MCKFSRFSSLSLILFVTVFSINMQCYGGSEKPKYGPLGHPLATPLSHSNEYFRSQKHPAPDFWDLISFYVPQYNHASCGAASLTMVLNASRAHLPRAADDPVIQQEALIEKVNVEHFKERITTGYKGAFGMSLDRLASAAREAYKIYGFPKSSVEVVHISENSKKTQAEVVKMFASKKPSDFVIVNFNQRNFTDDADVGHHAPVGAYDAEKQQVLILDPDREFYEPYWVSLSSFVEGMATQDSGTGKQRGYLLIHSH